uniref:microspherule protein 1-like n=1 Tax=Ciona intestinalis TaxID=7719 RepID=UPI000180B588|nr:microspherule protein 1-like [Ciona intestinalis]|eukprot:XP_009858851.1 microspherule protein 1-like [Ciona intestinalis]
MSTPGSSSRRHSSRSIKRRRFDDELVESSLLQKPHRKSSDGFEDSLGTWTVTLQDVGKATGSAEDHKPGKSQDSGRRFSSNSEKKSGKRKKIKKTRQAFAAVKDMGRWKPTDDIMLIDSVEQVQDLALVHLGVKFSCHFTLEEVQERWYALLYDPVISALAKQAMKALPREVAHVAHQKALFSKAEEEILSKILTSALPSTESFEEILNSNATVFHQSRTPAALEKHWNLMKQHHLLEDQVVQPLPQGDHILSFSDAEDMLDDQELSAPRDEAVDHEMRISDRKQKREIKQLEEEIPRWEYLVSSVTGVPTQELDQHTVAVLRGRLVRYLMRSKEITIGRSTEFVTVDIDLSLEGPASKISRRQGTIKMKSNGDFVFANEGKRPMFIDGKAIQTGSKAKLFHESVLEIGLLRFVFLINQNLVNPTTVQSTA